MGKKISKQQTNKSGTEVLGVDVRQLGVTVAGVIVGELVQAATQRLTQKSEESDSSKDGTNGSDRLNPVKSVKSVATKAGDQIEDVGSTVGNAAHSVQASASDLAPYLGDLVGILQDAGQRLKDKSVNGLSNSPESIVQGITTSARNAIDALTPDKPQNSLSKSKKSKKSKKKGKKKKK
ncbi:MAG: hypothetical protein ICV77_03835 [Cyanobacteria bacterium Co-bin8]|nr:hypothetical protein [Cyanobacteria bacterium Co-bin8]